MRLLNDWNRPDRFVRRATHVAVVLAALAMVTLSAVPDLLAVPQCNEISAEMCVDPQGLCFDPRIVWISCADSLWTFKCYWADCDVWSGPRYCHWQCGSRPEGSGCFPKERR